MAYENKPWVGELAEGTYHACMCGETEKKPFCDGSHSRKDTGKRPALCALDEPKRVAICQCGLTQNSPFCDGSHSNC